MVKTVVKAMAILVFTYYVAERVLRAAGCEFMEWLEEEADKHPEKTLAELICQKEEA